MLKITSRLLAFWATFAFIVASACDSDDPSIGEDAVTDVATDVGDDVEDGFADRDAEADESVDDVAIDFADAVDADVDDAEADLPDLPRDVVPDAPTGLPRELPFELTREDVGEPLTDEEIAAFTTRITGLWETIDYWNWVLRTTHGVHESTGQPEYLVWWHDVNAVKEGDLVTFRNSNSGGGHNVQIPTSRVLAQAAAGYLATGDEAMGRVVEQLANHYPAFCEGLVHDEDDDDDDDDTHFLMARNIVTQNHSYAIDGGRDVAVDYTGWYSAYETWNTSRFNYPDNPTYGDIWVTNMRSKDDVPHVYLAAAMLRYVIEDGQDEEVRDAAARAYEYIQGFARDIVDSGYQIRTRDVDGNVFVPDEDLATFVGYEAFIPNGECNAKLATALIAYGAPLDNDCDLGISVPYEHVAVTTHYFNYAIINNFHIAAIQHALIHHKRAIARRLLEGLASRIDDYLESAHWVPGVADPRWERDLAVLLVEAAAVGLPLTSREARLVVEHFDQTIDPLLVWPRWDLWDESVPDGVYDHRSGYRPASTDDEVKIEDIAWILHYCYSPFRNPSGAELVDCEVVLDMSAWGE